MKIAIVGIGKMGSWVAEQLALSGDIVVYDSDPKVETRFPRIDSLKDLKEIKPDLVVNAVSLQQTIPVFEELLSYIPSTTILSDIASVKTGLPEFYAKAGNSFVSVHPMFGPTFARLDSIQEENAIIVRDSSVEAKSIFVELFARLGVRVFEFSFAEHDKMMAYSLTTPFIATLMFALCVDEVSVPGTTFARHKKIAEGLLKEDTKLLSEILFNPASLHQLETITAKLEFIKHVIKARDEGEVTKLVERLRENIGIKS